jgi:hypothetical protein
VGLLVTHASYVRVERDHKTSRNQGATSLPQHAGFVTPVRVVRKEDSGVANKIARAKSRARFGSRNHSPSTTRGRRKRKMLARSWAFWRPIIRRVIVIMLVETFMPAHARVSNQTNHPVVAQAVITGRVIDAQSREPIAAATVSTNDGVHWRHTSSGGTYRFSHLAAGTYTILFSARGYQPAETRPLTVLGRTVRVIDVALRRSPNNCEARGVSAPEEWPLDSTIVCRDLAEVEALRITSHHFERKNSLVRVDSASCRG